MLLKSPTFTTVNPTTKIKKTGDNSHDQAAKGFSIQFSMQTAQLFDYHELSSRSTVQYKKHINVSKP